MDGSTQCDFTCVDFGMQEIQHRSKHTDIYVLLENSRRVGIVYHFPSTPMEERVTHWCRAGVSEY